jgi:hypothetical protein
MLSLPKQLKGLTLGLLSLSVVGLTPQASFALPLEPLFDTVGLQTVNGITQGLLGISILPQPNQQMPPQGGQMPPGMPLDPNGFPIPLDPNGFPIMMPQGNMGGMPPMPLPPNASPNGKTIIINNY